MGDESGVLLADSLKDLPFIQSINICNNKLTDVSLGPILTAIMGIPGILRLDFSENIIGPKFAALLADYLVMPSCECDPYFGVLVTSIVVSYFIFNMYHH